MSCTCGDRECMTVRRSVVGNARLNDPSTSLKTCFGGEIVPSTGEHYCCSSPVGLHVKASLVKVSHKGKTYRKAQTLQAPPSGQVWKSYYFVGSARIAMRVQVNGVGDKVYYLLANHDLAAQDSGLPCARTEIGMRVHQQNR